MSVRYRAPGIIVARGATLRRGIDPARGVTLLHAIVLCGIALRGAFLRAIARRGIAFVLPVALVALAALAIPARAADVVVGKVLAVRGEVVAQTDQERVALLVGMAIRDSQVIVAADGKARIELVDGTLVSVGENSRVRVADIAKAAAPATRVELLSGALRLLVVKVTPGARFEVETETAIAAVRGTEWAIEAAAGNTGVVVLAGSVEVRGRDGGAVLLDRPENGTDVRRGSAPTPPARWGSPRLAALLARTSLP